MIQVLKFEAHDTSNSLSRVKFIVIIY